MRSDGNSLRDWDEREVAKVSPLQDLSWMEATETR
jgi:hypothetical protein